VYTHYAALTMVLPLQIVHVAVTAVSCWPGRELQETTYAVYIIHTSSVQPIYLR
jgi:hypothetical protein